MTMQSLPRQWGLQSSGRSSDGCQRDNQENTSIFVRIAQSVPDAQAKDGLCLGSTQCCCVQIEATEVLYIICIEQAAPAVGVLMGSLSGLHSLKRWCYSADYSTGGILSFDCGASSTCINPQQH